MPAHNHTAHIHAPKNFGFLFAVGAILNFGLVIAQFLYGIYAHSIALIADAGHNLGDVLGIYRWGHAAEQPGALDLVNFERHRAVARFGYHF